MRSSLRKFLPFLLDWRWGPTWKALVLVLLPLKELPSPLLMKASIRASLVVTLATFASPSWISFGFISSASWVSIECPYRYLCWLSLRILLIDFESRESSKCLGCWLIWRLRKDLAHFEEKGNFQLLPFVNTSLTGRVRVRKFAPRTCWETFASRDGRREKLSSRIQFRFEEVMPEGFCSCPGKLWECVGSIELAFGDSATWLEGFREKLETRFLGWHSFPLTQETELQWASLCSWSRYGSYLFLNLCERFHPLHIPSSH